MKRFLSLLVALVMVLSLVQLPAFAASEGTDYVIDGNTIRILTQEGWDKQFSTHNVAGKTIYLDCDITIKATGAFLNCSLIGREGGSNVTLTSVPMFSRLGADTLVSNLNLLPYGDTEYNLHGTVIKQ